jgi:hypothetical protein
MKKDRIRRLIVCHKDRPPEVFSVPKHNMTDDQLVYMLRIWLGLGYASCQH